jgi:hypothetical protein
MHKATVTTAKKMDTTKQLMQLKLHSQDYTLHTSQDMKDGEGSFKSESSGNTAHHSTCILPGPLTV